MRILGNTVLLAPVNTEGYSLPSGLFSPNHYRRPTLTFTVLAIGPGEFVKRKKKRIWMQPEVAVGDSVLCRGLLDDGIVRHSFDDGTGRILVDARGILAKF